ncbi:type 4a pilus biogenesis protein PilO [Deinococcus ruber]|uniref:Pilus assembly protein PilO n=1 Tax=Deinococcus ruber TaxID=1848197 RepID=A0A918FCG4_9DEIO|nr:type 4a pilus biogenesis protein PilO [Deinococcus ruber]GGR30580.1 hypothetical protein GCM10008957_46650 [Deinococcus ruber]
MNTREFLPTLAVLLIGGLVVTQLTLPPLQSALSQRDALNTDIQALQQAVQALPQETQRHQQLQAEFDALKSNLPDAEHLPSVLQTLSETAHALNVRTGRINRSVRPSSLPGVTAIDLDMTLLGSYARTQAYIQTLARLPRAYTTRSLTLSAGENGLVAGTLKLTTYTRDTNALAVVMTPASTLQPPPSTSPSTRPTPLPSTSSTSGASGSTPTATASITSTPLGGSQ